MTFNLPTRFVSLILLCLVLAFPAAAGADGPAESDPWLEALRDRDLETLDAMLSLGAEPDRQLPTGKTALMVAAQADDVPLIRRLLEAGAEVDATNVNGGTALMFAAIDDSVSAGRLLIENGADVNAEARFGWTALMVAAVKGRADFSELLLAAGADPEACDAYGWTPLMRAVAGGHLDAVDTLLADPRVNPDRAQESGATALHIAAGMGYERIVEHLLADGADPVIADQEGRTPREVAENQGHRTTGEILRKAESASRQQVL
jgi:ankyrin repeat protein